LLARAFNRPRRVFLRSLPVPPTSLYQGQGFENRGGSRLSAGGTANSLDR
jgi:hypothetical protein